MKRKHSEDASGKQLENVHPNLDFFAESHSEENLTISDLSEVEITANERYISDLDTEIGSNISFVDNTENMTDVEQNSVRSSTGDPHMQDIHQNCSDELSFYNLYPPSTIDSDESSRHRLKSNINNPCRHCYALHFIEERKQPSTIEEPAFSKCCCDGTILSSLMEVETPKFLFDLLTKDDSHHFLRNIRVYNGQFAFTSSLANLDESLANMTQGVYTFRVSGNIHHFYKRRLLSERDEDPIFAQLYIFDQDYQLRMRSERYPSLDRNVLSDITDYINKKTYLQTKCRQGSD